MINNNTEITENKTLSYARITELITSIEAKELLITIEKPRKKSFIKSFFADDLKTKHYADIWHEIESLLNIILWEAKHKKKNYIPFIIEKEKNIIEVDFDFNKIDLKLDYEKLNDIAITKIDEYSSINLKKSKVQEGIIYFTLSFLKTPNDIVNIRSIHNLFLICVEIGSGKNGFKKFLNFIQIINIAINYINNDK